jgi:carbon monoxide dehydrogenase subunit G
MEMTGEYRIEAPREAVWTALNDPEVLKQVIPGCEEIEKTSDTEFEAKVKAKVGPVSAKFAGKVTLSDLDPPNGYTISGEGKGGAAGFARGGAKIRLEEEDGGATILYYEVDAQVGGKLAQIGSRLIDGTAKKMAGDFFGKLSEVVGEAAPAAEAPPEAPAARGLKPAVWITGLIALVVILLILFARG